MRFRGSRAAVLALGTLCVLTAVLPATASATPTGSCKRDATTPSHYDCQFYTAGNGISGGSPVVDVHGTRVGYLNGGSNFVDCQEQGSEYPSAGASVRNDWWAWTEANDGKWGWVSAYWASGGSNDEQFSGVPACPSSMGSAPIVGAAPTQPQPPSSGPTNPNPTRCSQTSHGTVHVTFREYEQNYQASRYAGESGGYGPVTNLEKPGHHTFATLSVSSDTCKGPQGWHLGYTLSIGQRSVGLYPGADDSPTPRGSGGVKGMGIAVEGVRNGVLSVRGLACTTTEHVSWWKVVHKIVGLIPPIPDTPFAVGVGKYVLGLIPTSGPSYTTHCGNLGVDRIHIAVTRRGGLRGWSHAVPDQDMNAVFLNTSYTEGGLDVERVYSRRPDPPLIN
jgi:hypothetical protein